MKKLFLLFSVSVLLITSCKDENAGKQISELQSQVRQLQHNDSTLAVEVDSLRMLLCAYIARNTSMASEKSSGKIAKKAESGSPSGTATSAADPVAAKPPMSKAEANFKKMHSWECSKCHKVADIENKPKAKPCPKGGMHDWQ